MKYKSLNEVACMACASKAILRAKSGTRYPIVKAGLVVGSDTLLVTVCNHCGAVQAVIHCERVNGKDWFEVDTNTKAPQSLEGSCVGEWSVKCARGTVNSDYALASL